MNRLLIISIIAVFSFLSPAIQAAPVTIYFEEFNVGTGDWLNLESLSFFAESNPNGFGTTTIEIDNIVVSAVRFSSGRFGVVEAETSRLAQIKILFQKTHPCDGFSFMTGTIPLTLSNM